MRPLRPLFRRTATNDELEREAARVRNRDWVEILRVVHPAQAETVEREYLLSRLREDWSQLVSALLAQHSLPATFDGRVLLVHCDHNTFANELTLIAATVEKKMAQLYGITARIKAKAIQKIYWPAAPPTQVQAAQQLAAASKPRERGAIDQLIEDLEKI